MTKKLFDVLRFNTVLFKLIDQQVCFPLNIAYKLFKLKKELTEIEELMFDRWEVLFGKDYNIENFSEEQIQLYNITLQTEINIDLFDLNKEDIFNNEKASLSIQDIEIINIFFKGD